LQLVRQVLYLEREARHAALVADVATAEAAHRTALATLEALRLTAPHPAEIERRQMRCDRLEQALANRNDQLRQLEREIGHLSGQIQTAGGEGVGEALAAAQEQRLLAERECARNEERVAVLRLLRDTVLECLKEGREHYYAPVRRHLQPFLNDLFPGAELELGDGFAITGIKRQRTEAFGRLSDGTQEQIAVLVRLAMGAMLAERGTAAPIILDDALVYSDDDRIQRMFDALSRAGKNQQIIVLTCRLRSFGPLGGHALRVRTDTDTPAARSCRHDSVLL
jgi:recombinational DNA repair ATPase RecF